MAITEVYNADAISPISHPSRPSSAMSSSSTNVLTDEITNLLTKIKSLQQDDKVQDQLKLFVQEWKFETTKEKEELEVLKTRVQQRKQQRIAEEAKLTEMRVNQETMMRQMAEEEKQRREEDKLKRLEEAERRRQQLMEESQKGKGKNFVIERREQTSTSLPTDREPTAAEVATLKAAALSVRIKPLQIDGLKKERLKRRAAELWENIVKLETEFYDLEMIRTRQDYDHKELKERQKIQLRHKAMKLGLQPEALMGKYPPKIMVASKYERRAGLKPFSETKGLFEGGFLQEYREGMNKAWMEKQELFTKRDRAQIAPWLEDTPKKLKKQQEEEEEEERRRLQEEEEMRRQEEEAERKRQEEEEEERQRREEEEEERRKEEEAAAEEEEEEEEVEEEEEEEPAKEETKEDAAEEEVEEEEEEEEEVEEEEEEEEEDEDE